MQSSGGIADAKWFALRVRSNFETKVNDSLTQQSIGTFLPTSSEVMQWADRKKTTIRPLFPGYVFARLEPGPQMYTAIATRGVVQILPSSHHPVSISDQEIESVRLVIASRLHVEACEYVTGDLVTIDSGPLAGVKGIVKRTVGETRVAVSIEMLHRSIFVTLDADVLLRTA